MGVVSITYIHNASHRIQMSYKRKHNTNSDRDATTQRATKTTITQGNVNLVEIVYIEGMGKYAQAQSACPDVVTGQHWCVWKRSTVGWPSGAVGSIPVVNQTELTLHLC